MRKRSRSTVRISRASIARLLRGTGWQFLISERSLDASESAVRAQNPKAPLAHVSLVRPAYAATWLYLLAH